MNTWVRKVDVGQSEIQGHQLQIKFNSAWPTGKQTIGFRLQGTSVQGVQFEHQSEQE